MTKVLLIITNSEKYENIFKYVEYPVMPTKEHSIEYQDDWALANPRFIYVTFDKIEIGIEGKFSSVEIDKLIELGWSRNIPING